MLPVQKCTGIFFKKRLDKREKTWYYITVITVLYDLVHLLQKGAAMFSIDLTSRVPIYEQIHDKIIVLIMNGTLSENDQLPSVRSLAKSTGVNPNTVAKAYQELERSGIIYSVPGRGGFISKKDSLAFQKAVLADFDSAVTEALQNGLSPVDLKCRIDKIDSDMRKEN